MADLHTGSARTVAELVREQGGIRDTRGGIWKEELAEVPLIYRRRSGQTPDVLWQMAMDRGLIGEASSPSDLIAQLKRSQQSEAMGERMEREQRETWEAMQEQERTGPRMKSVRDRDTGELVSRERWRSSPFRLNPEAPAWHVEPDNVGLGAHGVPPGGARVVVGGVPVFSGTRQDVQEYLDRQREWNADAMHAELHKALSAKLWRGQRRRRTNPRRKPRPAPPRRAPRAAAAASSTTTTTTTQTTTRKSTQRRNPHLMVVNPTDARLRQALKVYREFHGVAPRSAVRVQGGQGHPVLVALGALREVVYQPRRGHRRGPAFVHAFGPGAVLCATPDGKHLLIVRGKGSHMRVDWRRGIIG